jgi:hypothetical protein
VDEANQTPSSGRSLHVTLELLGALLFFSLAIFIQEIVAQDIAAPTEANFVDADATSSAETDARHTE